MPSYCQREQSIAVAAIRNTKPEKQRPSGQSGIGSVRQASDCKSRDEIGQSIDKRLVDLHTKRILRKQITVSHENAALPHQAYGSTKSCALLCVWRQESAHNINRGRKVRL
jgi:hypothetical protein